MKKLCVLLLLLSLSSIAASDQTPPIKLHLKTNQSTYTEGDTIQLMYSLENVTDEPVGFYEFNGNDFKSFALMTNGEPIPQYNYAGQGMMPHAGNYIMLEPQSHWNEKEEVFGRIYFQEVKDFQIGRGKMKQMAKATIHDGFMIGKGWSQIYVEDLIDNQFIIYAQYCTANPNPFKFTQEDCLKKEDYDFSSKPFGRSNIFEPDKAMYCQNYDERNQKAFIGCVESEPVTISINLDMPDNGIKKAYDEKGRLVMERTYVDGELNGETKYYYLQIQPEYQDRFATYGIRQYKDGQLNGKAIDYFSNDQPEHVQIFKDGVLDGESRWYYNDGTLRGRADYKAGKLNGTVKNYFADQTEQYSGQFKEGKYDGMETYYYPSNTFLQQYDEQEPVYAKTETNWKDGVLHGDLKEYYVQGGVKTVKTYVEGILKNIKAYDQGGHLIADHEYGCADTDEVTYPQIIIPLEANILIDRVTVTEQGVEIIKKADFEAQFKNTPTYISPHFTNHRMLIKRDDDLSTYRADDLVEADDLRPYAFIGAFNDQDSKDLSEPNQFLYFGKFEGKNRAAFVLRGGLLKSRQSQMAYMYVDDEYASINRCGADYIDYAIQRKRLRGSNTHSTTVRKGKGQ